MGGTVAREFQSNLTVHPTMKELELMDQSEQKHRLVVETKQPGLTHEGSLPDSIPGASGV